MKHLVPLFGGTHKSPPLARQRTGGSLTGLPLLFLPQTSLTTKYDAVPPHRQICVLRSARIGPSSCRYQISCVLFFPLLSIPTGTIQDSPCANVAGNSLRPLPYSFITAREAFKRSLPSWIMMLLASRVTSHSDRHLRNEAKRTNLCPRPNCRAARSGYEKDNRYEVQ